MQIHWNEALLARLKVSWEAPPEFEEQRHQCLSMREGLDPECQVARASLSLVEQALLAWDGGLFAIRGYHSVFAGERVILLTSEGQ